MQMAWPCLNVCEAEHEKGSDCAGLVQHLNNCNQQSDNVMDDNISLQTAGMFYYYMPACSTKRMPHLLQ